MECVMTLRSDAMQSLEKLARMARVHAYGSSRLSSALSRVRRSSDVKRIERLKLELDPIFRRDRYSAAKYADFDPWVLRNIHRAGQLGLHKTSGLRILDIGAGPGYFVAAARALGHDCVGIDVDDLYFTPLEHRVYTEMLSALNCRQFVSSFTIERFAPLSVRGGRFDLITAFLVCFNRHDKPNQWGVPEWRYFVDDAMQNLNEGGGLFLGLNDNVKRYGKLSFYDEPLLAYFRSVGRVDGARITIRKDTAHKR
jgi:SAM-dependent methyltransferase